MYGTLHYCTSTYGVILITVVRVIRRLYEYCKPTILFYWTNPAQMTNESLTPVSYQWESVMSEFGDFIIEVEPLVGLIGKQKCTFYSSKLLVE